MPEPDKSGSRERAEQRPGRQASAPKVRTGNAVEGLTAVERPTGEERWRAISEIAYRRAERRGFTPGGEVDDWLAAEREFDAGGASSSD